MARLRVIAPLLNMRTMPVENTADKTNVKGEVAAGFEFDSVEEIQNQLGTWYKDNQNNFYWGGGLINLGNYPNGNAVTKQSFSWFKDLAIENIWNTYHEYGDAVTVAVLDTGYNQLNVDLTPAVTGEQLFINYSNSINDKDGHGTFCASVIGARNLYNYNIGIAPRCRLLIGKISNKGELSDIENIFKGIQWAIEQGADIISISFGKRTNQLPAGSIPILQARLDALLKDKKVLILAAADDNYETQVITGENYPASLQGCVSVGASDKGLISIITVRNAHTIIHSQGIDVESYKLTDIPEKDSGTSMATPIVAGVAALAVSFLKKKNADWNPVTLLQEMYNSGDTIPDPGNKKLINPTNFFAAL